MTTDPRQWTASHYQERVDEVVSGLRRLADEIERRAKPYESSSVSGTPRFTAAAEDVLHAITWGLANLNAHYLVSTASIADAAERGETDE